jgi:hypothetical protein
VPQTEPVVAAECIVIARAARIVGAAWGEARGANIGIDRQAGEEGRAIDGPPFGRATAVPSGGQALRAARAVAERAATATAGFTDPTRAIIVHLAVAPFRATGAQGVGASTIGRRLVARRRRTARVSAACATRAVAIDLAGRPIRTTRTFAPTTVDLDLAPTEATVITAARATARVVGRALGASVEAARSVDTSPRAASGAFRSGRSERDARVRADRFATILGAARPTTVRLDDLGSIAHSLVVSRICAREVRASSQWK